MKPVSRTMFVRTAALSAGVALAGVLAGLPQAGAANVGVTAAVNVDAKGRPPGGAPRVLALGQNVIHNEEISTDGRGLVQILLLDGTTFTVGPNSNLVIDEFVYNPDTGDATVVASVTKGAFRFIGAKTSEKAGGATINTPVGTIGVRGGMVEGKVDPGTDSAMFSMVFGDEVNFTGPGGETARIYKDGYTLEVTGGGQGEADTNIRPRTNDDAMTFQTGLSGGSGQSGGASETPTDETVVDSEVSEVNSDTPDIAPIPEDRPVEATDPDEVEEDVAEIENVGQDEANEDLAEQDEEEPEPEPEPEPETQSARVLTAPEVYVSVDGESSITPGRDGLVGSTPDSDREIGFFSLEGRLISSPAGINLPDLTGAQGDAGLVPIAVNGTADGDSVSGTGWAGRGDFAAYMLGYDGDPTRPFYLIYGTPTDTAALLESDDGFDIREYSLTADPIRPEPVPFFMNDLYGSVENFSSTNLYVVESGSLASDNIRAFQGWVDIQGAGLDQKSAAFVMAANVFVDEFGVLQLATGRRGSYRHDAFGGPTNIRGSVATIAGASGDHFFGDNAEHFVMGTQINPADGYADAHLGPGYTGNPEDGFLSGGYPGSTHHVGSLVSETPMVEFGRHSRTQLGFMAGIAESSVEGIDNPYFVGGGGGPNMWLDLNAESNTVTAVALVSDVADQNDVVDSYTLSFQGVFVDDDVFGARQLQGAPGLTVLETDDGSSLDNDTNDNPGSYLLSGRAAPIEGYEHCTACDFIDWGWWGTRVRVSGGQVPEIPDRRTDFVHMGTWVAGDLSDPAALYDLDDLPFGGSATYEGTALGTVALATTDGVGQFIARGDVTMGFDFADRSGSFAISDFGGMNVSGAVSDPSGSGFFGGGLSGAGGLTGSAGGVFVDDGPNVAAGVMGDFSFGGPGVAAVGTFAAAGSPATP